MAWEADPVDNADRTKTDRTNKPSTTAANQPQSRLDLRRRVTAVFKAQATAAKAPEGGGRNARAAGRGSNIKKESAADTANVQTDSGWNSRTVDWHRGNKGWDTAGRTTFQPAVYTPRGGAKTPAAENPVILAQNAVPVPGIPGVLPITPHFIPGTKENKQLTDPAGRALWRNVPESADVASAARRTGFIVGAMGAVVTNWGARHILGNKNPPETFPVQDQKPEPRITPIPNQAKPEIVGTPIPEPQKAGPVGGGFQPAKPDFKNEGLVFPKPAVNMNVQESSGKPKVLDQDSTGKVHGDVPKTVPKQWTRAEKEEAAEALAKSIAEREREQQSLGEDPAHRSRIEEERDFLRKIQKNLSGS